MSPCVAALRLFLDGFLALTHDMQEGPYYSTPIYQGLGGSLEHSMQISDIIRVLIRGRGRGSYRGRGRGTGRGRARVTVRVMVDQGSS